LAGELKKVSLELVRECSRLLAEVLESRKRILEHKARLGVNLETPRIQAIIKEERVDLAIVEKIKPDTSTTALSSLTYLELLAQHNEVRRIENLLLRIVEETKASGMGKVMKSLSSIVSIGRKTKTSATSDLESKERR
jgi:hypothetical protein